ncbi:hypothetical protein HNP38_003603 [Chryseobacterium defluvii]|uniref:Bacterial toxin 47 domain-containing protein n=1 Tax=Chryseobacterium defluvii TaxID=160396 RepID=A0A840KFZ1_9FLAO|nr:polymorphic toxin type 47 domain-containing protein [Chryseobacterium defluvii]MBB4808261.1 hypothetical protein [Chryseobacterium defluvii]
MIGERIGGPGDPPDRSFVRRVWDWIWGVDRGHKSDKRLKGNYTIVTGIPIGTFERDEQTSWEAGDTRYEKVTVNTLITRKIGANNESPKYRFILPQNFGGWSQDNTGSDGLIWKGCLSCHADNGAFTYAVHNSQEANAGRMLSAVLQTAVGASLGIGKGYKFKSLSREEMANIWGRGNGEGLTGSNWQFNPLKDVDMRGGATHLEALEEAFKRTGVPKELFKITRWGKDANGKSIPVEYIGPNSAEVNMDIPKFNNVKAEGRLGEGPHQPHVGYKFGKGSKRIVGHIFIDNIPATR